MAFEQATIKVEKEKEFSELKAAISHAFAPENVEKYLKKVASAGLRVRDFDAVLAKRVLEQVGALSIESNDRNWILGLCFDNTFVMAAVSVVFP